MLCCSGCSHQNLQSVVGLKTGLIFLIINAEFQKWGIGRFLYPPSILKVVKNNKILTCSFERHFSRFRFALEFLSAWLKNFLLMICDVSAFQCQRSCFHGVFSIVVGLFRPVPLVSVKVWCKPNTCLLPFIQFRRLDGRQWQGPLMWSRGDLLKHLLSLTGIRAGTFLATVLH